MSDNVTTSGQGEMTRDENGRVSTMMHADGRIASCEYDGDTLIRIRFPYCGEWAKAESGWERKDEEGNVVDHLDGEIIVSDEGDLILQDNNGATEVSHLDGSFTTIFQNNSRLTRDPEGRIIYITHPNGKSDHLEYSDYDLILVRLPDHGSWQKMDYGWVRLDRDGNLVEELDGAIQVTDDGDLVLHDNATGETDITHLNGSITVQNPDQSQMTINTKGNVISMTQPNGRTAHCEYQGKNLIRIQMVGDGEWRSTTRGWERLDEYGNAIDQLDGEISVSAEGDFVLQDKYGAAEVSHLDGTYTTVYANNARISRDSGGRIVSLSQPNGRTNRIEYSETEMIAIRLPGGGSWTKMEFGWRRTDGNGYLVEDLDGEILLTEEGALQLHDNVTGETDTTHLDGSVTVQNPDQSQLTATADGLVLSVVHANGAGEQIEYGADRLPFRVLLSDGSVWEKQDESNWIRTDENGEPLEQLHGDIEISAEGDFIIRWANGDVRIVRLDGWIKRQHANKSELLVDLNGRVVSLSNPEGKTAAIEYGADDHPCSINLQNIGTWTKENGGWSLRDGAGQVMDTLTGTIEVNTHGDVFLSDTRTGETEINRLNGGCEKTRTRV